MKDILYRCDLCDATCLPSVVNQFMVGLHWSDFPIHGWTEKPALDTERHICKTCLNSLQIIGKNSKPAQVIP